MSRLPGGTVKVERVAGLGPSSFLALIANWRFLFTPAGRPALPGLLRASARGDGDLT